VPSFARALERGADAFELDVRVTRDGVPVVIHDPSLDRTSDRSGLVAELTLAEVQAADAGARFTPDGGASVPWRSQGVTVPTLNTVLDRFPEVPLIVELKEARGIERVRTVLESHDAVDRCIVGSFDKAALASLHGSSYLIGASQGEVARLLAGSLIGITPRRVAYRALTIPERHRGIPIVTRSLVRAARRLGCPVHVWTVDDVRVAKVLWKRGVAGIITNDPAAMVRVRAEQLGRPGGEAATPGQSG
jgi:glycerophosphoryl diester phosphodiesterase